MALPSGIDTYEQLMHLFQYEKIGTVHVKEFGGIVRGTVCIRDIAVKCDACRWMSAYWVEPVAAEVQRAVLYVHPGPGERTTFLAEAEHMAQAGARCLLVDAPWARGESWGRERGHAESDRLHFLETILDMRRAIDVLMTWRGVAQYPLGYVGHSLGAIVGGILAGIETRIQAYVLMAGVNSFASVLALNMPELAGEVLQRYQAVLAPIDSQYYLPHASPAALFFQFGLQDTFFPHEKFDEFACAASEPKQSAWYAADHFLRNDTVVNERMEWLYRQLLPDIRDQ